MSWTTPKTWAYKEVPGSDAFNTHIRDNMVYLKASTPVGVILPYAGSTAPDQYLLCDGSAVSRATYADLFAAIGVTYGAGDESSTFNLPDLRGRIPVGKSTDTEFDTLGETGGEKAHTLLIAEMPAHAHKIADIELAGNQAATAYQSKDGADNYETRKTSVVGGGGAHNNLQPYQVINYIIKY